MAAQLKFSFLIRPFQPADLPVLSQLYESTIRELGPALYSPAQIDAWAIYPHDKIAFADFIQRPETFVAVDRNDCPIGFAGLEQDGRIASLYVAAERTRQGIGSALLDYVIAEAKSQGMTSLWSEASFLSQKLFEKFGFETVAAEHVVRNSVQFKRWIVKLPIRQGTR